MNTSLRKTVKSRNNSIMSATKSLLSQLDDTNASINRTIDVCLSSKKRSEIQAALCSTVEQIESAVRNFPPRNRELSSVKKSLIIVSNTMGGIINGLVNQDMTPSELRSISKNLRNKFSVQLSDALCSELSVRMVEVDGGDFKPDESVKRKVSQSADFREALSIIKKQMQEQRERAKTSLQTVDTHVDDESKQLLSALERAQERKSAMPKKMKGSWAIERFPIIPLFESDHIKTKHPASSVFRYVEQGQKTFGPVLKSLGVKHTLVKDYVILEDQIVLYFDEGSLGKMKPEEYAKTVVEVLQDKSNVKYTLVSSKFLRSSNNRSILVFWIMPSRTLSALVAKGWAKVRDWGFAWQ